LNDVITKHRSTSASEVDSYEVGWPLTSVLIYATHTCPAEPATSSMDIALRAAVFPPRGVEVVVSQHNIMMLSAENHNRLGDLLVMFYRARLP
jgi:hypothetical protein